MRMRGRLLVLAGATVAGAVLGGWRLSASAAGETVATRLKEAPGLIGQLTGHAGPSGYGAQAHAAEIPFLGNDATQGRKPFDAFATSLASGLAAFNPTADDNLVGLIAQVEQLDQVIPGAELSDPVFEGGGSTAGEVTSMRVRLTAEGSLGAAEGKTFELPLPSLLFEPSDDPKVTTAVSWKMAVDLVADANGLRLEASDSAPELAVKVDVTLDTGVIKAEVGALRVTATPVGTPGFHGTVTVDFPGSNLAQPAFGFVDAGLDAAWDLVAATDSPLLGVEGRLHIAWKLGNAPGIDTSGLTIDVENVVFDATQFLGKSLSGVTQDIGELVGPIAAAVEPLDEKIPALDDLATTLGLGEVTLLTIAENSGFAPGVGKAADLILLLDKGLKLLGQGRVPLGSIRLAGEDALKKDAAPDLTALKKLFDECPACKAAVDSFTAALGGSAAGGGLGFTFPVIEKPETLAQLLLGRDIDLIKFDTGPLGDSKEIDVPIFTVLVFDVELNGYVEGRVHLSGGFDTSGIRQAMDDPAAGLDEVLNGLYLDNPNGPSVFVYSNVGVAGSVGLDGIIEGDVVVSPTINVRLTVPPGARLRPFVAGGGIGCALLKPAGAADFAIEVRAELVLPDPIPDVTKKLGQVVLLTKEDICDPNKGKNTKMGVVVDGVLHIIPGSLRSPALGAGMPDAVRVAGRHDAGGQLEAIIVHGNGGASQQFPAAEITRVAYSAPGDPRPVNLRVLPNGDKPFELPLTVATGGGADNIVLTLASGTGAIVNSGGGDDSVMGGSGNDAIVAGPGKDLVAGGDGADRLFGESDDDSLDGGGGDDVVHGNAGNDILAGGPGLNTLVGHVGDDVLVGGRNADKLFGDEEADLGPDDAGAGDGGADVIVTGGGADEVVAGNGIDYVYPVPQGSPFDTAGVLVKGNGGNDEITTADGLDTVFGGPGADKMTTNGGADKIYGGEGADSAFAGDGDDLVLGQEGDDTDLRGGNDDDRIEGGAGSDTTHGDGGQDDILGGSSPANVRAGLTTSAVGDTGDALLSGGDGADVIVGDNGSITRPGGADPNNGATNRTVGLLDVDTVGGDDRIAGDAGDDRGYGAKGADVVEGGVGDDHLEGNAGADSIYGTGVGPLVAEVASQRDQDDLIGGSSAVNPAATRSDTGEALMRGDGGQDVMIGDNGEITRPAGGNGLWLADPDTGGVRRNVTLADRGLPASALAAVTGADLMEGGDGRDRMYGQAGDDAIKGNGDDDFLQGNRGGDLVEGNSGGDDIVGGTSLASASGAGDPDAGDYLYGGEGPDVITGDNAVITRVPPVSVPAEDYLTTQLGIDRQRSVLLLDKEPPPASARFGADQVSGGGGVDVLFGQDGVDHVTGGAGDDYLQGNGDGDFLWGDRLLSDVVASEAERVPVGVPALPAGLAAQLSAVAEREGAVTPHGQDDMIGGSTIKGFRDGSDVMAGDGSADFQLGDNGELLRTSAGGAYITYVEANPTTVVRQANRFDVGGPASARGNDFVQGNAGDDYQWGQDGDDELRGGTDNDDQYGELGNDRMFGEAGEDAMVGDRGVIVARLVDGSAGDPSSFTVEINAPPAVTYTAFRAHALTRRVDLVGDGDGDMDGDGRPVEAPGLTVGGHDFMRGGPDHDSMHGAFGDDLMNGDSGGDALFGADGSDAMWGGRGSDDPDNPDDRGVDDRYVDYLFGGYGGNPKVDQGLVTGGADILDYRPRPGIDPPSWLDATDTNSSDPTSAHQHHQGIDWIHGGWDRDVLQADVAGNGPNDGDRLLDWNGAYNLYTHCNSAYGGFNDVRQLSPAMLDLVQKLAFGNGIGATLADVGNPATSAFRELALVYPSDSGKNSAKSYPTTPGHFEKPLCAP